MEVKVTAEFLALLAGAVLSLAFSYIPGLKALYDPLSGVWKRVVMAALLLVVSLALFGLGCAGIIQGVSCDRNGIIQLVGVFISALMANQSTYMIAGSQRNWRYSDEEDLPEM